MAVSIAKRKGYVPAPLRDARGDRLRLARQVEAGIPFAKLSALVAEAGLSLEAVAEAIRLPQRTMVRRRQTGRLSLDESERLVRLSRIIGQAVQLFEGDIEAARRWLQEPKVALQNQKPWDVVRTEPGARQVEVLIRQVDLGVYA